MEASEKSKTVVAKDVEIVGSIKCGSNIRIDGKLNGDLSCAGNVVVGNTATIKGNISVESVTVEGTVNGNTTAKDLIDLKSTARVTGDIRSKRLTVEDGVSFVGKSEVNPSGSRAPAEGKSGADKDSVLEDPEVLDGDEGKGKSGSIFGKK